MTPEQYVRANELRAEAKQVKEGLKIWEENITSKDCIGWFIRDHYRAMHKVNGITDEAFSFFRQMAIQNLRNRLEEIEKEFLEL